ncbi:hypothetical protein COT77_01540 [Candidatus Berkelbacteria bacterium CG10_big_fil_rev_8_21_14_0_10_41_12]|uniref:TrbC/VirB2 family protein n=1 Tax=Candidatus Berkelbacteria bacterium CG10_big_fil_rev_8_21_14_0_10_41_12 TaxID=1974513 RepID=A0A2M6WX98_9BACT|nr:MAG: hypothetical protein COT77_01540 [Candidatus Berkelbacteria bacterium CG10_big_fil_rev_8_21_14_0_10_41_12]
MWDEITKKINDAIVQPSSAGSGGTDFLDAFREALLNPIFGQVMSWLTPWLITITVAAVFYGAFMYFTAYGNEQKALVAKKAITAAFIGVIISGLSFSASTYIKRSLISQSVEKAMEGGSVPGSNRTEIQSEDQQVIPNPNPSSPFLQY